MTRVEGKGVVIDRSVDDVWRFMTDISNMPQWEENQADWKQTSEGPIESGTTFQIISRPSIGRPFGWEMKSNLRITEFEPNRKFATEATSGFLEGTKISYLMEPVEGDKTRLSRVTGFVQAWARSAADARAVQHDTGIEDNEWWATSGPMLARVLDEMAYPIAARVGSAAGAAHGSAYSPGHAYTFGLERVLAGLSQLIDSN